MPPTVPSRLIGPSLAVASALFAGGVWLIPGRVLTPDTAPPAPVAPPGGVKPAYLPPPKETRWPELASKLEALREPWKGPDPALAASTDQQPTPSEVPLSWEYVGLVETARVRAAIIAANGTQRFVSVGETLSDPSFPSVTLRVRSISEDKIEVEHLQKNAGQDEKSRISTVPRKQPAPAAVTPALSRGPDATRIGSDTPGLRSGAGRSVISPPPILPPRAKPPTAGAPFPNPAGSTPAPGQPGHSPNGKPVQPVMPPGSSPAKAPHVRLR